jgi:hypothetical protein
MRPGIITNIIGVVLLISMPARAYVDRTFTIGRQLAISQGVALYEIDRFNRENGVVFLKKISDIKGDNVQRIKQSLFIKESRELPRHIIDWAEPGGRAVIFSVNHSLLVCLGFQWYVATEPAGDTPSYRGINRPEMPLSYCGPVMRLAEALKIIQAGGEAVITAIPHNTNDVLATVDTAMNRTNLPGLRPVIRVKASLKMPMMVMSVSDDAKRYILGTGAAGIDDLPELKKNLSSEDPMVRAEAADDLRSLKDKALPLKGLLEILLSDENPRVASAASGALLAIEPSHAGANQVFLDLLKSTDATRRRAAVRTLSMMGQSAKEFTALLAVALSDPDEGVRALSLEALCTMGNSAASAWKEAAQLLDDPAMAADAAETLGRMGSVAKPCLPKLVELLKSPNEATQWAAARGLVQIGGPDADPVIDFLIKKLEVSRDNDAYNIMMYFVVLGPDGKRALPSLQRLKERDAFRYMMAVWSMDPENTFPWDTDAMPKLVTVLLLNQDIIRQNFEAIIREIGDRARPAARSLAQKTIEGTSGFMGNVPGWGYQLLVDFPDEALPILEKGLKEKDPIRQQGALMAIGHMGVAAKSLKDQVNPLTRAENESTRQLAQWCVKQIEPSAP